MWTNQYLTLLNNHHESQQYQGYQVSDGSVTLDYKYYSSRKKITAYPATALNLYTFGRVQVHIFDALLCNMGLGSIGYQLSLLLLLLGCLMLLSFCKYIVILQELYHDLWRNIWIGISYSYALFLVHANATAKCFPVFKFQLCLSDYLTKAGRSKNVWCLKKKRTLTQTTTLLKNIKICRILSVSFVHKREVVSVHRRVVK